MSFKALESAVEIKRHKADNLEKKLWRVMRSVEALDSASCTKNVLRELVAATEEFGLILQELDNFGSSSLGAAITPYSCHGVFTDRSIFSLNLS